jgi:hypothetical protein
MYRKEVEEKKLCRYFTTLSIYHFSLHAHKLWLNGSHTEMNKKIVKSQNGNEKFHSAPLNFNY